MLYYLKMQGFFSLWSCKWKRIVCVPAVVWLQPTSTEETEQDEIQAHYCTSVLQQNQWEYASLDGPSLHTALAELSITQWDSKRDSNVPSALWFIVRKSFRDLINKCCSWFSLDCFTIISSFPQIRCCCHVTWCHQLQHLSELASLLLQVMTEIRKRVVLENIH